MSNCQKCGADERTFDVFKCDTVHLANGKLSQSDTCRIAELTAEVERLQTTYAVFDYDRIAYVGHDPVDAAAHIQGSTKVQVWRHGKRQYKEET
jgi:hypothetical protein